MQGVRQRYEILMKWNDFKRQYGTVNSSELSGSDIF